MSSDRRGWWATDGRWTCVRVEIVPGVPLRDTHLFAVEVARIADGSRELAAYLATLPGPSKSAAPGATVVSRLAAEFEDLQATDPVHIPLSPEERHALLALAFLRERGHLRPGGDQPA